MASYETDTARAPEPWQLDPPDWVTADELAMLEQAAAAAGSIADHAWKLDLLSRDMWIIERDDTIEPLCALSAHHACEALRDSLLTLNEDGTVGVCPACGMITTSLDFLAVSMFGRPRCNKDGKWDWSEDEISMLAERLEITSLSRPAVTKTEEGEEVLVRRLELLLGSASFGAPTPGVEIDAERLLKVVELLEESLSVARGLAVAEPQQVAIPTAPDGYETNEIVFQALTGLLEQVIVVSHRLASAVEAHTAATGRLTEALADTKTAPHREVTV